MAERLVRFFGPAGVSATKASPTTLFTVPTNKTYILRQASLVLPPAAGGAAQSASFVAGIGGVDPTQLIVGLGSAGSATGASTETVNLVTPIVQAEAVKGYYSTGGSGPSKTDFDTSNNTTFKVDGNTTDATSFATAGFTAQELGDPTNVFFVVANTKATTPDAVTTITDAHTNPVTNIGSIISVATSTTRASIWGGYAGTDSAGSAAYTVDFTNTQTACSMDAIAVTNAALAFGTPSTSNIILQTATNTGTSALSQGVTMTPTSGADSWQLLVVQSVGSANTYSSTGGTQIGSSTHITPTGAAAAFFYYPAVTNPTAVLSSGTPTAFSVVCIEGATAGVPTITLSGLVIE